MKAETLRDEEIYNHMMNHEPLQDETFEANEFWKYLYDLIYSWKNKCLKENEAYRIMELKYKFEYTNEEIAKMVNLSRDRVIVIHSLVLRRLRHPKNRKYFQSCSWFTKCA